METHVEHGFEMASFIPGIALGALDVIRHHHERWNGTGYPQQLAGDEIPILARIFSICDVYDALISPRPYKAAWSPTEAVRELWCQRGAQFDPIVVEAFLSLEEILEEIQA